MKLAIPQPELAALLARGGAVSAKVSLGVPILSSVRITAYGDCLAIASSDTDRFAEAMAPVSPEATGACCVDAAKLAALISRYPKDGVVTMELESPSLLRVKCGRSRVGFAALPAADFPAWGDIEPDVEFAIKGAELADLFGRTRVAMQVGNDHAISSVYVGVRDDGAVRFAATDRAIAIDMRAPIEVKPAAGMLVPAEAIEAATKVFKDQAEVTVQWSANKIGFVSDGVKVAAKLLADQYPPWWENLLATRSDTRMVFSRRDFLAALDRAVLAADTEGVFSSVIAIPRDDGLELKAMGGAGGEAREGVEADIAPEFKPFGFNPNRIAALLGAMRSDRVTFEQVPIPNSTEFRYVVYADDEPEFAGCFAPVIINKALAA